ncbi:unnamed protein product [Closterium sp. NIES-54]
MFITLYFIVTRLPDSLHSVRDHFLTLDPTSLTVDLLEQHLLAAETSAVAVGATRGTPRSPFFEGCSPTPLSSSFPSAAAAEVSVPEDVGAASTSAKRRNSKGKGGRGSGGGSSGGEGGCGSGSGGSGRGGEVSGGGGGGRTGGGGGGSGGGGGGSGGSGGSRGGGTSGGRFGSHRGGPGGGQGQQQQCRSKTQTAQQLREWLVQRGAGEGSETCPYVIRTAAAALGASASGTPPGTAPSRWTPSAFVAELVDFDTACRLDYATALLVESESASPPSVGGECAFGTDVLEDRREEFECLAAAVPRFASLLLAPEGDPDAPEIPTPRSYAEAITVDGMWILRVKRPLGSPPAFKARYVARGFSQREGVDYFQTFFPTPKMTTLWVLLHVASQRDYELHSLDFTTAFMQGSLHEEIWLRRPPGFTGLFPAGTQWSLRRPVYSLRQAPREWHDTLRTTLAALGFVPSTADLLPFLRTDTSLPPFYVLVYVDDLVFASAHTKALTLVKSELQKRHTCTDLGELRSNLGLQITRDRAWRTITLTQSHMVHQVLQRFGFQYSLPQLTPLSTSHSLSAPPSDESVEPSGPYPEFVGCLMYLMTCTRPDLAYPLCLLARYVAPGRHRKLHWDAAKRVLRYLCSTSGMGLVLGGRGLVVLTGHADASWELRWLTYLLTDLGEQPRLPPVLYIDNKAMIALCQEHRLEHRTKHIALQYFLSQELQQCGQLRLAHVATRANTADVFTKALPPGDHQRFFTVLGLVPTLPY